MLRKLHKSDLPYLMLIENAVHVSPWTEDTFQVCFQSNCTGWAIEIDKRIIAFIFIAMSSTECHVLNLCVDRPYQRKGWGQVLLEHALKHAASKYIQYIYLEVRQSNTSAIKLYEKSGFQQVGTRKDYYPTSAGREDAYILARLIEPKRNCQ